MGYLLATTVAVTTSTGGAFTGYTNVHNGYVRVIKYKSAGTASTADLTITTEDTGLSILATSNMATNADVAWYPRSVAHTIAGAASGIAQELIPVTSERVKVVMAQGGNAKTGTVTVIIGT